MSQPSPHHRFDGLEIDASHLARGALNVVRTMVGILGTFALILGIALLVWPGKSLVVLAALTGVFFVLTGMVRISVGTFLRQVPTGFRVLNIILGLVVLLGGIITLKNLAAATGVLTLIVVLMIGVGWIIDGIATLAHTGRSSGSAWSYVRGALSIVAGIVVLVVPAWSALALVILAGATLVALGLTGVIQAFALGKDVKKAPTTIDA